MTGPTRNELTPLGAALPRIGFETTIATATPQRYLAARALDISGRPLATSSAVSR